MTKDAVFSTLTEVFRSVFDDDAIVLTPETSAADIEDWDSLNQIRIVVAAQGAFKTKLDARQMAELKDVGQMVDYLAPRLG